MPIKQRVIKGLMSRCTYDIGDHRYLLVNVLENEKDN